MQQQQNVKSDKNQASTQGAASRSKAERMKSALKGMDYDEQQQALAPEGPVPETDGPAVDPEEKAKQEAAKKQADFEQELKRLYERQFGPKLGGKLYDLITKAIGPDALMKHARQGVESGLKSLGKLFEGQEDPSGQLQQLWGSKSKEIAAQIAATPEIQAALAGLSNFVREHPAELMLAALVGAVLAGMKLYSDNFDIPALEGMFKVNDNLKLGGKVDLGRVQQLTVDSLHANLELHVSRFTMKLDIGHDVIREEGKEDRNNLTVKGDAALNLLNSEGKEVDPATQQVKREWATKLSTTFGGVFQYNEKDWSLEAMQLAAGLALEARDKRLVDSQKLDRLEKSEYRETILRLYANYLQKFKNYEGSLQPSELSLAMGLSLVMKRTVEIKTVDGAGEQKNHVLNPLQTSFNLGLTYNDKNSWLEPGSRSMGVSSGLSIGKDNWSLGASVDYTHDLMKNQGSFGGKLTFTIRF
ncbi:MAG: hypothetical protein FJ125_02975 [Deltaproteobacteria bacterium]|nr:hypothetical protein [Deltaproteobacteria bacterium]